MPSKYRQGLSRHSHPRWSRRWPASSVVRLLRYLPVFWKTTSTVRLFALVVPGVLVTSLQGPKRRRARRSRRCHDPGLRTGSG
jgi:hypothetical protein